MKKLKRKQNEDKNLKNILISEKLSIICFKIHLLQFLENDECSFRKKKNYLRH